MPVQQAEKPLGTEGGPNLFICVLVMFLNRVLRQKWFNHKLEKNLS